MVLLGHGDRLLLAAITCDFGIQLEMSWVLQTVTPVETVLFHDLDDLLPVGRQLPLVLVSCSHIGHVHGQSGLM